MIAVLGNNGAGKSTLLRALSGTLAAQRGTVTGGSIAFAGRSLVGADPADIARSGLVQVPEGRRIFGDLTVEENLRAGGLAARDKQARARARARVDELFPILGERRTQRAGLLSGGEQQMLAIGRALMASPRVLLLDEPSLGLAPRIVERVRDVIAEINADGVTVVLVEQNAAMALALADDAVRAGGRAGRAGGSRRRAGRERRGPRPLPGHRTVTPARATRARAAGAARRRRAGAHGPTQTRRARATSGRARVPPHGRGGVRAGRERPHRALRRRHRALGGLVHGRARLDARADRPQRGRQVDLPERAQRRLRGDRRQRPLRRPRARPGCARTRSPRSASSARSRTSPSPPPSPCSTTCWSRATG